MGRLRAVIVEGYAARALQKLPHITLLNPDFYHSKMKPVLAEWAFLWLQKQHLHGIERDEAIMYVLEGAVARSDLTLKLQLVETALAKCEVELGEKCEKPEPTKGYP